MKASRHLLFAPLAALAGFLVGSWREAGRVDQFKARISAIEQSEARTAAERDQWRNQAEQLEGRSQEVHRLRNEVSALSAELAASRARDDQARTQAQAAVQSSAPSSNSRGAAGKEPAANKSVLTFDQTPPLIQAAIIRAVGNVDSKGVHVLVENGETNYALKGKTDDGRSVALRLAEDGSVRERHLQIQTETLPAQVTESIASNFGQISIGHASEVIEGENVFYDLSAKSPEQAIQMRIGADGTILAYSTKLALAKGK